jgi:bacterioferritin-associated ferredoxin
VKQSTNAQSSYVCACARITEEDFKRILEETENPTYAALKAAHGIGGQCTSCEYEVKGLLDEHLGEVFLARKKAAGSAKTPKAPVAAKPAKGNRLSRFFKRMRGERIQLPVAAPASAPAPVKRKEPGAKETYRTGVFFIRKDGLESHLAIANLQFPEHADNPNGLAVSFHVSLYGEDGTHLATSREMMLPNNRSIECTPADLFPEVKGDVIGAMYTDFDEVAQTGSLRPYGVLVNTTSPARARCHYHDKFALFTDPGFFQNTSPFEPGQECWMSISNCQAQAYESEYHLQAAGETWSGKLVLGPLESRWVKLAYLFPGLDATRADLTPGLFWLENPQHVMVYFFWHIAGPNVWMAQHH